jgi:hypothetical protein
MAKKLAKIWRLWLLIMLFMAKHWLLQWFLRKMPILSTKIESNDPSIDPRAQSIVHTEFCATDLNIALRNFVWKRTNYVCQADWALSWL